MSSNTLTMASEQTRRVYKENDKLDERLLNQISKWILYHRLPSLARHLGISDAEITRIMIPSRTPEEQCFQVLKKWNERTLITMKPLMEAMLEWHQERYLDPGVWNHLRPKLHATLLPEPADLELSRPELLPPPLEHSSLSTSHIAEPQPPLAIFPRGKYSQAEHESIEAQASSFVRRRITTVVEETLSTGNQMYKTAHNAHLPMLDGTVLSQNTPTHAMVTCEQSSHEADTGPFPPQSSISTSTVPSGDEPEVSAERIPSMESVSVRKKGRYEAHDKVDQYLLLQVSRHVQVDMVELLAAYLGVSEEQYVDIRTTSTQPTNPRAQAMKVWHKDLLVADYDVRDLMQELKGWVEEGFLKADIWSTLQKRVNPGLLPTEQVLENSTVLSTEIRTKCKAHDPINKNLLHEIAKYVYYDTLPSFARDLRVEQPKVTTPNMFYVNEQIYQILDIWLQSLPLDYTVKKFAAEVKVWTSMGYLDVGVWKHLQNYVTSDVLPSYSEMSHMRRSSKFGTSEPITGVLPVPPGTIPRPEEIEKIQKLTRRALDITWRNSLSHDWISPNRAKTFPLMEYYTDLRWTRTVKRAMQNIQEKLSSIFDIFSVPRAGEEPTNLLVEAEPGMGKTCSLAYMALKWVKEPDKFQFHFVFLIQLRYVDKTSSLGQIIKFQHNLRKVNTQHIESILEGETNHKVLLLLDGYDEYRRGSNKDIDDAIGNKIGNCFLILTSRPGNESGDNNFISKLIRNRMDGEIVIEGFSPENIKKCSIQYLHSEENSRMFLTQAKKTELSALLHVPIILLMGCTVFISNMSLPHSKTKLYEDIFYLIMDRTTLKTFGCKSSDIPNIEQWLSILGKLSWEALQNDTRQLLLNRDEIEDTCPDLLRLGLLSEVGIDAATVKEQSPCVSFHHKSLQGYSASKHIVKKLEESPNIKRTLKELFPSWENAVKYEEVIAFTCGLMKNPRPLLNHVYETFIEWWCNLISFSGYQRDTKTKRWVRAQGKDFYGAKLLNSIYTESIIPLFGTPFHNQHVYFCLDDKKEIVTLSKLYMFGLVTVDCMPDVKLVEEYRSEEVPESIICIDKPDAAAVKSLLSTCCEISKLQPLNRLIMTEVFCDDLECTKALTVSKNAQSVRVTDCDLPMHFWENVMCQLSKCVNLRSLWLRNINLNQIQFEIELDKLLQNLESKPKAPHLNTEVRLQPSNLSQTFVTKWSGPCSGIRCLFDDSSPRDRKTIEGENASLGRKNHFLRDNITLDQVNVIAMSPPPERLILRNCGMSDDMVFVILFRLPIYNSLTVLDLSGTKLGSKMLHIRSIIESGNLRDLRLPGCDIPQVVLGEILPLLSSSIKLTHLNLSRNNLEGQGFILAKVITAWGIEPDLKEINLSHCSMTRETCKEILLALGSCKSLTKVILSGNVIQGYLKSFLQRPHEFMYSLQELDISQTELNRDDLSHLAQLLKNKLPCVRELDLENNSLHKIENELENLLQSCVTNHQGKLKLKLRFNNLAKALLNRVEFLCNNKSTGQYFDSDQLGTNEEKIIYKIDRHGTEIYSEDTNDFDYPARCLDANILRNPSGELCVSSTTLNSDLVTAVQESQPYLNKLVLRDCVVHDDEVFESLISLPICKFLSVLDFGGTNLGYDARHMANIIKVSLLKEVCLRDCHIPASVSGYLFTHLSVCENMTHLDMSGNKIDRYGYELADTIHAWGPNQVLKELDLSHCSITTGTSRHLLSVLGSCEQLSILWLPGNTLTGCLSHFLPDQHAGLPSLEKLFLNYTMLNNRDVLHLVHLIEKRKLSGLKELDLGANRLHKMTGELEDLVESCATSHQRELKLCLWFNNLPIVFVNKCKFLWSHTNIKLVLEPDDARNTDK